MDSFKRRFSPLENQCHSVPVSPALVSTHRHLKPSEKYLPSTALLLLLAKGREAWAALERGADLSAPRAAPSG
jgi:hypothetical protein